MIDATVAPKVGFISPFGTTACNVNHINAQAEARATAPPTHDLRKKPVLWPVASSAVLGPARRCGGGTAGDRLRLRRFATKTLSDVSLLLFKGHLLALRTESIPDLAHHLHGIEGFLILLHNVRPPEAS